MFPVINKVGKNQLTCKVKLEPQPEALLVEKAAGQGGSRALRARKQVEKKVVTSMFKISKEPKRKQAK